MTRSAASERQVRAADPAASTWLSANAGSGKTRVLTDRVARLLLQGVRPSRILCLTYTKAAASEMQNRLFGRLGGWAMLPDDRLRGALRDLGVETEVDTETLREARRLFARAIETPGGLKIQTIHAFCASLLRSFPLEAGVSPSFTELDERGARRLREEIVEDLAEADTGALDGLAEIFTGADFGDLTETIARNAAGFTEPLAADKARALFGLSPDDSLAALLGDVLGPGAMSLVQRITPHIARGSANDAKAAARLGTIRQSNLAALTVLEGILLTGKSAAAPFTAKIGSFPTKPTREKLGADLPELEDLMQRIEAARPRRLALEAAEQTAALHRFATAFLSRYAERKARAGWLDFDDLIGRAVALLTDPSVAQWVLYRLDGGVDHILVDEAQDTSPEQWRVIELLAQEFTAGQGARDAGRTIFVVGDKKQSIYSFQGADLRAFDRMRDHFAARLAEVQVPLRDEALEYSFRSSPAILGLVDHVFDDHAGLGGPVRHLAFFDAMPGRVDLWPVVPKADDPEDGDWSDPVDVLPSEHHGTILARRIADQLRALLDAGTQVPTPNGPKRMTAGDVLILVQRRSALFHQIIAALKAAKLPVAGADRLRLGGELAVKDLTALLSFLATPEDDLSLAACLRSPLFGWTEAQLYDLAHGRDGYLWTVLRGRADAPGLAVLQDLRRQADYLRPYELIERMLTRHGGRRRLIARLGMEAEDGIDAFLAQALAYERLEVPSLTGFLGWLAGDAVEVKRQLDSAGDMIRVMTVHGAKGLEAPVVILPDTGDRRARASGPLVRLAGGKAVWGGPSVEAPDEVAAARAALAERDAEERLRLLYVALTRAESWLIVAAAGEVKPEGSSWYRRVESAIRDAGAAEVAAPDGFDAPMLRLSQGDWPVPDETPAPLRAPMADLPDWAMTAAALIDRPATPLSPSDLGGAKVLGAEGAAGDQAAAMARGTVLHLLLEHLPMLPRDNWPAVAASIAGPDHTALLAEARAVLDQPDLAPLFCPEALAEVEIAADLDGRRLIGTIDRLIVDPDRVLAVDYKSNAAIPGRPEDVPEGLLRQMGAYAHALAQIWPGRRIETALLWTRGPRLMVLPTDLVMAALHRAPLP
jgi:ATP-dependent helicase/nuclease subunit A